MSERRRRTSVSDTEPVYRVVRPKLTMPRLWKTERFDSQITINDLHWAAEKGNINLLADLLMQNHPVNATDAFGRTPLHEAAEHDQLQAADWLMFDGADSHKKDYESRSPISLSSSEEMARILLQNPSGKKPEILILLEDTTYHVDSLDIRVVTGSRFGPTPTYMMCRRVSPSKSSLRYRLTKGERFWRDVIEYKVSLISSCTMITVDVLVVDRPPSSNDLVVKTEDGDGRITDIKPKISQFQIKDKECWICTVTIQLDYFGCFALCSRPRSEVLPIPGGGGQVVSKTNSSVRLNVPPQAFRKQGNVLFTIEEVPEMEKEESILSLSHFYNMEHTSCSDTSEDIEVTLPIPKGYTGEGEVVVLSRPGTATTEGAEDSEEGEEEEMWEVSEATVRPEEGSVSFRTHRMGINSPVEVEKGTNREDLRIQTARIYSRRKECHVKFLVVGKILGFNQFDIVVECVKSDQIYLRIDDWKTDLYTKLRVSGDFPSRQNQKYRLELQGNLKCLYGLSDLHLEFLPGQTSHQSLLVTVLNVHEAPNGNIAVHEVKNSGVKLVTQLPVLLKEQLDISSQMEEDKVSENVTETEGSVDSGKSKSKIPRRMNSFPGAMQGPGQPSTDRHTSLSGGLSATRKSNVMSRLDEVDAMTDSAWKEEDYSILSLKLDKIPRTPVKRREDNPAPGNEQNQETIYQRRASGDCVGNVVPSSATTDRISSRRASDLSRDCLPAGVGSSVTLDGAAASARVGDNATQRVDSVSEAVSELNVDPEKTVSSLSQHVINTAPASEDPEHSSDQQGLSAPVSDNFFVRLVQVMQPNFLMFIRLGLTNTELKKIQRNTSHMDTEYTMFEMLVQCRQKRGDNAAFLHTLLLSLEELEENATKQWVVEWMKQWLQGAPYEDQPFANKIRSTVHRFDNHD